MSSEKMKEAYEQLQKCEELSKQLYLESGILWSKLEAAAHAGDSAEVADFKVLKHLVMSSCSIYPIASEYKLVIEKLMTRGFEIHGAKLVEKIQAEIVNLKDKMTPSTNTSAGNDSAPECNCETCQANRDKVIDFAKAILEKTNKEFKDKK